MKINSITAVFFMALAALSAVACGRGEAAQGDDYSKYYHDLPIDLPVVKAPVIPVYTVSITDFGGVNDGVTKNTEAFTKAMSHLAIKGGGRLIVPEGIWYTGPISFESNVELHLDRGALVLFSEDLADYPSVSSSFEDLNSYRAISPLSAFDKENIAITGEGSFNGNGQCWRPVKRGKMTASQWKKLTATGALNERGDIWFPNERIAEVHDFLRPALLSLVRCKNVLLKGVTFENSPGWNIHPFLCENLIVDSVNVRNPWYAQNGDGIDAESCTDVLIVNSSFDVGDDTICIKSGKDKEGRERGVPCANVLIEGCTVYHGHGAFVIGSEMSGGCKEIAVRNCVFIGTDVGLRFKSTRGRGGVVENIYIDNIKMSDIPGSALLFDLYYGGKGDDGEVPAVTEETPSFKDIYINDVTCRSAERAMYFNGLPEMPIKNITVKNSLFRADTGVVLNYVDGLTLDHVVIYALSGQSVTELNGVTNLKIID